MESINWMIKDDSINWSAQEGKINPEKTIYYEINSSFRYFNINDCFRKIYIDVNCIIIFSWDLP
jgi:hypothetical protein